ETPPVILSEVFELQKRKSLELRGQTVRDRKRLLNHFADFILSNRARIGKAVHADFKKPLTEVDMSEIYPVLSEIRHTVSHLSEWCAPQKIDAPITYFGTRSRVVVEPKGVCLIIAPWNYPFSLCFGPLISCLAAGNTAIIKPSEMTPHTSALINEMAAEFFDPEMVTVVEGGLEVSQQLLRMPFDHIFFTGSPAVGKAVMKAASEHLTSVTLELGGKSPTIIDETANLTDAAERIAFGKFLNNGQTCIAPDYVLVHESVQAKLVNALKEQVLKMFGDNGQLNEQSPSYARIVNAKHFLRLTSLIDDAVSRGAKLEMGGTMNAATSFIHPVILTNVSLDSKMMEEEIFGPVLPVIAYRDEGETVQMINSKPKPLALYVFSNRQLFIRKVLSSTSAGTVCINECVIQFTHANLPFGGVNNSGIGKSHGYYGFMEFSNQKPILKQMNRFSSTSMLYPPFTGKVKILVNLMLKYF
ncbi:MAG: aldehyde dehydrogenase family protein, partial [Flammeovirgaceae bacterium]